MTCTRSPLPAAVLALAFLPTCQAADKCDKPIELITRQSDSGNLAGWKAFCEDSQVKTADVWTLTGDGVLICKGNPKGYIYTEKGYTNFVLSLQWRWPVGQPGNGGVLVRTTGEHKIWPKSLEAQINAGDAGDFWGLGGYPLDGPAERKRTIETEQFGKLTNLKKTATAEQAAGAWNTYKITAQDETVTLVINGLTVNRATGCTVVPGKICLTAEGSEIHFRNIRLVPISDLQE